MAVDSRGSKGEPQFLDGGAPDLAVDANAISDYAAAHGNFRVGTRSQRDSFTTSSAPWVGLGWFDTTDSSMYRYAGAAGWKRDSGYVLGSPIVIPWSGAEYVFGGTPTPNQPLASGTVPDPGRPYRLSFNVRCELGQDDGNTRYHLALGTGGQSGNFPYAKGIDFASLVKGAPPRLTRVDTGPTVDVFTGSTRVVVQADLIEGTAYGRLAAANRSFVVTQWAA